MISPGIAFAMLTLLTISLPDVIMKRIAETIGAYLSALVSLAISTIPVVIVVIFIPPSSLPVILWVYSIIGGAAYGFGLMLVMKSLETEQASNTWALVNLTLIPVVLLGAVVLNEPINNIEVIGILAVLVGSLMVTISKEMKFNKKLIPAIVGNMLFVVFYVVPTYAVSQTTSSYSSIYVISYAVAVGTLLIYGTATSKLKTIVRKLKIKSMLLLLLVAGILGGLSQVAWLFTVVFKTVALGGAVVAIEPTVVVVLSYLVYKERLTLMQGAGIAISVTGAIIISLL